MDAYKQLMTRNEAEIAFSGRGPFDIFKLHHGVRIYIGTVLLDLNNPPFVIGDCKYFKYAPGFMLFPRGVARVRN